MTKRLLIDTDPGVDDALAILMACQHARVEALTVAAGNTGLEHTLRNACRLVDLHQATTPVFGGCSGPLVQAPAEDAAHVHGMDGFGDAGLPQAVHAPSEEHAAQALVRLTREAPGELTLVALAPLTNLALAVRLDPGLPARVGRLVIMGGAVNAHGNMSNGPAEFNIGFDPEAAHVVFDAFDHFDLVDWELVVRQAIDTTCFDGWLAGGDERAAFFARISSKSRSYNARLGRQGIIAADAAAMAVALDEAVISASIERPVTVELDGRHTRGMTVVDWEGRSGRSGNARIVTGMHQDGFEALVAAALGSC